MSHYSLDALTDKFRTYMEGKWGEPPEMTHWGWLRLGADQARSKKEMRGLRFTWGDFSALSYAWGSPDEIKTITLNGRPAPVGANLEAALRTLRTASHFAEGLLLWVDAICINQTDLSEKSQVLPIMQMLYCEAAIVTVWLGAPNATCGEDLAVLTKFAGISHHESIMDHDIRVAMGGYVQSLNPTAYTQTTLPALINVMDRPYWTRMWVMQELTRSSPEKQLWDELREVMAHYISHMSSNPAYDVDSFDEATLNRAKHATRHVLLLGVTDWIWRISSPSGMGSDLQFWNSILHNAARAGVGDERDRVYGLLSLMPSEMERYIQADYSKTVGEGFTDLSIAAVKGLRERAYGVVFVGHREGAVEGVPSWACALERHRAGSMMDRANMVEGDESVFRVLARRRRGDDKRGTSQQSDETNSGERTWIGEMLTNLK